MKNITLSADEGLIDEARRIAAGRGTTLDAEFRQWLEDYVGRHQQAEKAISTIHERQEVIHTGGRKFTREEMNERHPQHAVEALRFDQEPVDYAYLEEHLDELDLSPTRYETMEEKHQRQGEETLRFLAFQRNLDEAHQGLSPREQFRLFLKQEGRHDKEQRRRYLLFTRYERQYTDAANWLAESGGSAPDLEDIPRRRSETPDSIPDYENMSLKELIENCPLERIDLERPMEYPRDIEF